MLPTALLLSIFTTLGAALPVLEPRICGSLLMPTTLVELHQNQPDTAYPNTAHTNGSVLVYQDVDYTGKVGSKINALVGFSGPVAGSYGCSLGLTFPSNYYFPYFSGDPTYQILNNYAIQYPFPENPTWNVQSHIVSALFGTVTVKAGVSVVVNSKTCPTAGEGGLGFVMSYADWVTTPQSFGWTENVNGLANENLRGVYLTYNC